MPLSGESAAPRAPLRNAVTALSARVASTLDVGAENLLALLRRAGPAPTTTVSASIGGLRIDLVTDKAHLVEFWLANWEPAAPGLRPHAILHALSIPGLEPHAYYCPSRDEAVLANTDYYGQVKSWALGMAGAILQRRFGIHSIHGACVEVGGRGLVIVGGTGSGKSTQVAVLAKRPGARLLGDDWTFIQRRQDGRFEASQPERMLYIRTDNAADDPVLAERLRGALVENAMTVLGSCTSPPCKAGKCMLQRGEPYCLWGHPNARALVPREWLSGPGGLASSTTLGRLVVLYRDASDPRKVTSGSEEIQAFLKTGRSEVAPGAGPTKAWGSISHVPYFNPYLLVPNHVEQDRAFADEARVGSLLVNTAHLGIEATAQAILAGLQ